MAKLFISYNSKDKLWANELYNFLKEKEYRVFLDSHHEGGIPAGSRWESYLYRTLHKCSAVIVLHSQNWLSSPWCIAEAILAREKGKEIFILTLDAELMAVDDSEESSGNEFQTSSEFLRDLQYIVYSKKEPKRAYRRLLKGLDRKGLRDKKNFPSRPYPGLEPFTIDDGPIFFGRDNAISNVKEKINQWRNNCAKGLIVILGASGCGKSSLVYAGVLPSLLDSSSCLDSNKKLIIIKPFPARFGLDRLSLCLAEAFREVDLPLEHVTIQGRIQPNTDSCNAAPAVQALHDFIIRLVGASGLGADANVVLVIDQLEEVFFSSENSSSRQLLDLVFAITRRQTTPMVVLTTMRSDFLNLFQTFPNASENYEKVTLDPMLPEKFKSVIKGPACLFDIDIEDDLTDRLIKDTSCKDALPLLALTLKKLYDDHNKNKSKFPLTVKDYERLFPAISFGGNKVYQGVATSVQQIAEKILTESGYQSLSTNDDRMRDLRRAFFRLAKIGDEGQFVRKVATWDGMPESCLTMLELFTKERLLTSSFDEKKGKRTLTVTHEALFRVWNKLSNWLDQDRHVLRLLNQIEKEADSWDKGGRDPNRLWPEERIINAANEIAASGALLDDVNNPDQVRAFLGVIDREEIETLLALTEKDDESIKGRGYSKAWQPPLGHETRESAGLRLALLGDSSCGDGRKGTGLREDGLPDIYWCLADGGNVSVEILSNEQDPYSKPIKTVTRSISGFQISRYPVTAIQFQAFLDDCYRDGSWHFPPKFPVNFPEDYFPPNQRVRYANYPASSVSWWDATAFCAWLTIQCRQKNLLDADSVIRLPTEFEWQFAATGGDQKRIYPWGRKWNPAKEPWLANTSESGLGRTTAVGMYPLGTSPIGALDMAGTLWEWCSNDFENLDYVVLPSFSTEARRVVRGGSWFRDRGCARTTYRYRDCPIYSGYSSLGFRLLMDVI